MAVEKPIVVTRKPDYEEVLTEGEYVLLIKPGSTDELAESVEKLLMDPELRIKLGKQTRKDVEQYDWKIRARKILDEVDARVHKKL